MKINFALALLTVLSMAAYAQQQPSPEQVKQAQEAMTRQMQLMRSMVDVRPSRLGFEETVAAIHVGAEKRGWKPGEPVDMQALMKAQGFQDTGRMKVVPACPADANDRIAKASAGKAPPLSCRVTVFESKDGKTYVMRMNLTAMSKLMEGDLGKAMADIGAEEDALFKPISLE